MTDPKITELPQTSLDKEDLIVSTAESNILVADANSNFSAMSLQEGVNAVVEEKLKHIVALSNMSDEDQIKHLQHYPNDFQFFLKPSDKVKEAHKFLVEL